LFPEHFLRRGGQRRPRL